MTRVAFLCNGSRKSIDAIRQATFCLAAALRQEGVDVETILRGGDGRWRANDRAWESLNAMSEDYDVVVLQYNPFLYGRRGFAPWLIRDFGRLRLARGAPLLVLYVHETAVP